MECRVKSWNRKKVWRDPQGIMGSLLEFITGGHCELNLPDNVVKKKAFEEKLLIQRAASTVHPLYPLTHTQSENARVRGRGRKHLKVEST